MGPFTANSAKNRSPLRVRGATRLRLRVPKSTACWLRGFRLASAGGAAPSRIGLIPALTSVGAAGSALALCAWGFPVATGQPPSERPILITMLSQDPTPVLDMPDRAATASNDLRPAAPWTDIPLPPPPAVNITALDNATLLLPLAQGTSRPVLRPTWSDLSASPGQPAAPQPAAAWGTGDALAFWQNVRALVAARAAYPTTSARHGRSGQVTIRIRVGPAGRLDDVAVATSSGDPTLDRAAVTAVREAAPFPVGSLHAAANTNTLEALIPLRFELVDRRAHTTSGVAKSGES